MKFTFEFGHRGKHSAARRAEALQEAVQALAKTDIDVIYPSAFANAKAIFRCLIARGAAR